MAKTDKPEKVVQPCERCGLKVTGTMVKMNPWSSALVFQPDKHKCYPRS